jgi:2-polyprenyl-3-methyl-5-hydroxy-6-metoxy-1,4-benzoquinol methylase
MEKHLKKIYPANIKKSIYRTYRTFCKLTTWNKLFIVSAAVIVFIIFYRSNKGLPPYAVNLTEGFTEGKLEVKRGDTIYDDFYASYYDKLLHCGEKNEFEVKEIIRMTQPDKGSYVLDVGSGTGHHVELLRKRGIRSIGVDKSRSMVNYSKTKFPSSHYITGDITKQTSFDPGSFSHILSLYFTIYLFKNKEAVFRNCYYWLKPGGRLVVHLVNKKKFDPIVPAVMSLVYLFKNTRRRG